MKYNGPPGLWPLGIESGDHFSETAGVFTSSWNGIVSEGTSPPSATHAGFSPYFNFQWIKSTFHFPNKELLQMN
jgi:hypothetical protein